MTELLRLQEVSLNPPLGGRSLLQNLSFSVQPGELITLVGPSGAGKTSLLRLLNRLTEVSQGQIYLEGQEIRQIPVLQLRRRVVLVLQESKLLGMTVRQAIAYPLTLAGLSRPIIDQRVLTWAEQLHIPTDWFDRTETQLSLGQRQRVAIARALALQPPLLLLDEPTAAQDVGNAEHLLNLFADLARSGQTTVLMVNHQLEWARRSPTRLLYLKQGRLVHDLPAPQVDWQAIQADLVETERQAAAVWE